MLRAGERLVQPARLDAGGAQRRPAPAGVAAEREQQVDRLDALGPQVACLLLGVHDDPAGLLGEPLEHAQRSFLLRACFLCTACRLTPRASAICCHDQPRSRALRTWSTSSRSASSRIARTARRPVSGSSAAAAVVTSVGEAMAVNLG